MTDENNTTETTTPAATSTAQPGAQPPAADAQQQPPAKTSQVLTIPANTMGKIKKDERAKGALAVAKELGYESVEEMKAAHAQLKKRPNARPQNPPRSAPQPAQGRGPSSPPPRQGPQGNRPQAPTAPAHDPERAQLGQRAARAEKQVRELKRQMLAREGEQELREAAVRAGITRSEDISYALHLIERELASKSKEELDAFDENAWFANLRKRSPYLFGERVQPATTGTAGTTDAGAPPPKPGTVAAPLAPQTKTNESGNGKGAFGLSQREFQETLRRHGVH